MAMLMQNHVQQQPYQLPAKFWRTYIYTSNSYPFHRSISLKFAYATVRLTKTVPRLRIVERTKKSVDALDQWQTLLITGTIVRFILHLRFGWESANLSTKVTYIPWW
jgi:hypothetical protein